MLVLLCAVDVAVVHAGSLLLLEDESNGRSSCADAAAAPDTGACLVRSRRKSMGTDEAAVSEDVDVAGCAGSVVAADEMVVAPADGVALACPVVAVARAMLLDDGTGDAPSGTVVVMTNLTVRCLGATRG